MIALQYKTKELDRREAKLIEKSKPQKKTAPANTKKKTPAKHKTKTLPELDLQSLNLRCLLPTTR